MKYKSWLTSLGILISCGHLLALGVTPKSLGSKEAKKVIEKKAQAIIETTKKQDWKKLASFVHPDLGLCLSPAVSECPKSNRIDKKALTKIEKDNSTRVWGVYDGSGEPIELSFHDYYQKFIFDKDFTKATEVKYNEIVQRPSATLAYNPLAQNPNTITVEFYVTGPGQDWSSLHLDFESKKGNWYLTTFRHAQWAI